MLNYLKRDHRLDNVSAGLKYGSFDSKEPGNVKHVKQLVSGNRQSLYRKKLNMTQY
jgi:hypothetical protein